MRAAAILGLGSSLRDLKPFQHDPKTEWLIGLPTTSDGADAILIFGGDGTVHRHLAQLVKQQLPVLVVPCGSGNDFARALGLSNVRASLSAWRAFCEGRANVRLIDLGLITPIQTDKEHLPQGSKPHGSAPASGTTEVVPFPDAPNPQGLATPFAEASGGDGPRTESAATAPQEIGPFPLQSDPVAHDSAGHGTYFCCVGGVGLDGEIARRANRLPRWLRGHGGYAISFPGALVRFAPVQMTILLPSAETSGFAEHRKQPTTVTVFANTPVYGGGMRVAPKAQLDDGRLDVCVVREVSKLKLFSLFPTVYFGRHLGVPEVEYFQAEELRLETEKPLDVYADGEYVCRTPIEVSVAPKVLRVVIGQAGAGSLEQEARS